MALNKKGVPFTLYEEAKEYSVVGYTATQEDEKGIPNYIEGLA